MPILILLGVLSVNAQGKEFRPTYICEGYIQISLNKQLPIKLSYLVLLDSSIVGSYFYKPSFGTLRLSGRFYEDNTFIFYERDEKDEVTGCFKGKKIVDKGCANGIWTDTKNNKSYIFSLKFLGDSRSYWSYIRKFRALPEYRSIQLAVNNSDDVLAFDIGNHQQTYLPQTISKLRNVLSVNIGVNQFREFPRVIAKLSKLQELSMSSNGMDHVDPDIGKLKNLRILIINFNKLKMLPAEIGNLRSLLYLDLGNNQLQSLPSTIVNLQQLQELHIERNKLSLEAKVKIKRLLPNCIIHFD